MMTRMRENHYRNKGILQAARGQACLVRLPGVCCSDAQTTVFAHSNLAEHGKGAAVKAHDCFGAFACHACHAAYDQPLKYGLDVAAVEAAFFRGMCRTWLRLLQMGVLR